MTRFIRQTLADNIYFFVFVLLLLEKVVKLTISFISGEIRIAGFVAEHNLPYNITDHLSKLVVQICPDSKVAKSLKCSRPRVQSIVENVIGAESFTELCEDLRNVKFSLVIDESTDLSTTKHLCMVARHVKNNQVRDSFLALIPLSSADATTLCESIVKFFMDNNIPYKDNLIGFASDGANVMMGQRHSVMVLLKSEIPNLFIMKCICHSFHLCASYAGEKIPRFVEDLVRDIYNYFGSSPKRTKEYEEFQIFCQLKIHKILHPCQTRWLSVHAAVSRILEQYPALKLYFIDAVASQKELLIATNILNKLNDPVSLLFLQFLDFVLPIFNQLNKEMQAEGARIHILYSHVCASLKTLLDCFLKRSYLNATNIEDVNFKNPHNFLDMHEMYFGAKVMDTLLNDNSLTADQLNLFRTRCLQFYIEASEQIIQRFPLKNNPLKDLNVLAPENVKKGIQPSLIPLCRAFSGLVNVKDYQDIDTQWRLLRNTQEINMFKDDAEDFWANVAQMKGGDGTPLFGSVATFVFHILSLPHSSANVERIFSAVNLIKTKNRNRLSTDALVGLLHAKRHIGDKNCYDFNIPKAMFSKISSQGWYNK